MGDVSELITQLRIDPMRLLLANTWVIAVAAVATRIAAAKIDTMITATVVTVTGIVSLTVVTEMTGTGTTGATETGAIVEALLLVAAIRRIIEGAGAILEAHPAVAAPFGPGSTMHPLQAPCRLLASPVGEKIRFDLRLRVVSGTRSLWKSSFLVVKDEGDGSSSEERRADRSGSAMFLKYSMLFLLYVKTPVCNAFK